MPQQFNCSQIVTRACAIAKAPGFREQCGQYLDSLLDDLQQTYDFDYIRQTITLNIDSSSASYDLPDPADETVFGYLRAREVFYSVNGTIFWCDQISLEKYDTLFQGPGISNYPYWFATDISASPPIMLFYPPPAQPLSVTVRYQPRMPEIEDIPNSTETPWFRNQRYLITKLAADLMQETDDARADRYYKRAEDMLRLITTMDDDDEGYAKSVKLDPLKFKNNDGVRATKQQPL